MKAIDVLKQAERMEFVDRKGVKTKLELEAGATRKELLEIEKSLPCALSAEIRELLEYSCGFSFEFADNLLEGELGYADLPSGYLDDVLPMAIPLIYDGSGNQWMIDLDSESSRFGPVFYGCHDPPVLIYQASSLAEFLEEIFKLGNAPWTSKVSEVHEDYAHQIWRDNPGVLSYDECMASADADLKEFASSLDSTYLFKDLRNATVGDGFSWGRFGARADVQRFGFKRIFSVQKRELTWWQKTFGV